MEVGTTLSGPRHPERRRRSSLWTAPQNMPYCRRNIKFMGETEAWNLVRHRIWVENKQLYQATSEEDEALSRKAASAGIEFVQIPQRHIGSDYTAKVIESIEKGLRADGVDFLLKTKVEEMQNGGGVKLSSGEVVKARYIIAAPGRTGASWLVGQTKKLGLKIGHGPTDVGVWVEVPGIVMT